MAIAMAKKNNKLDQKILDVKERISELRKNGYIPVATFTEERDNNGKVVATHVSGDCGFGRGVEIGSEIQQNRYNTPVNIPDVGTEGKGYIKWGADNLFPVYIEKLADALPYTASGLRYLNDLLAGCGLRFGYKITQMVNGKLQSYVVDYEDAYLWLSQRIIDLRKAVAEQETEENEKKKAAMLVKSWNGGDIPTNETGASSPLRSYRTKAQNPEPPVTDNRYYDDIGDARKMLDDAIKDMRKWEDTMSWLTKFIRNSNVTNLLQQWAHDDTMYNLSFVRLVLERGKPGSWGQVEGSGTWQTLTQRPKIIGIEYQPTVCSRFEEMDDEHHINNIYYAERFRFEGTTKDRAQTICAYPCIAPQSRWKDLTRIVLDNQKTKPNARPCVCAPIFVEGTTSPYYPTVSWWSIFSSYVYNLAATLMSDVATSRKNSTMWSKIIYIDLNWFEKICAQQGLETDEEQAALRNEIVENITDFLRRKSNNGKIVVGDKMLSADEKRSNYSFEVVDIPEHSSSDTLEDLEKITSCIFFALGIHPALVGAVPGSTTSSSGTQQRELTLLKACQLSPRQQLLINLFDFIRDWNDLDRHLVTKIKQYVLTTLDANKEGITEMKD